MYYIASHRLTQSIRRAVPYCIVIALAVALKRYYSLAEAGSLAWILAPTARCVELVTGIPFTFEQGTGFVNIEHRAVIAPACAGINFLIIVFCMVSFSLLQRRENEAIRLSPLNRSNSRKHNARAIKNRMPFAIFTAILESGRINCSPAMIAG